MVEGNLVFLFAALAIVWIGIIAYVVMLGGRLSAMRRELDALKRRDGWNEDDDSPAH